MKNRYAGSALLAAMMMGMAPPPPWKRGDPPEDEINRYLRQNNTTLAVEYFKIQERKSGLFRRQRNIVEYRYEKLKKEEEVK